MRCMFLSHFEEAVTNHFLDEIVIFFHLGTIRVGNLNPPRNSKGIHCQPNLVAGL